MATLVFLHGWSVTDTSSYGQLPAALRDRVAQAGGSLTVVDIHLSEYVTFVDTVTLDDIVRAFDRALRGLALPDGQFDCIAHSTGGPIVHAWLRAQRDRPAGYAPLALRHLVMLAPANFGSALAQLGKGTLGRLKAWFGGVEPGQRILDWLELGSPESLAQNVDLIHSADFAASGTYLFVLIGDRPDRKLYDYINSYTGEDGSDGVVRLAAANLNATHAVLSQDPLTNRLIATITRAPRTAFKLLAGLAHTGDRGIMAGDPTPPLTVDTVMRCLAVSSPASYAALCAAFSIENAQRDADKVELEPAGLFSPRVHIHDPRSMLIVRLADDRGESLSDTQFQLTAGSDGSSNELPQGFMIDRQANSRSTGVVTLFLNHGVLAGDGPVMDPRDQRKVLRKAIGAHRPYGARAEPKDIDGLVHHLVAATATTTDLFDAIGPHETTVVDVVLARRVKEGVFRFTSNLTPESFQNPVDGADI
ncbi:hypothetical protein EC912_10162 [Luteibacter rhizovicinus]|uniref:Phospholipase n=1 Tax=Luteibacter rhizovicinus TaxID=242606 RepID=A0A4R3YVK8_9GAMM|nr:phospholipase [Luteibacter rhizovicinus]TCV97067.1 hypothetical protein EC912_10162 [Luteibacter rhizovicinus]